MPADGSTSTTTPPAVLVEVDAVRLELELLVEIRDELRRLNSRLDDVHDLAVTAHETAAPYLEQLAPAIAKLRTTKLARMIGLT